MNNSIYRVCLDIHTTHSQVQLEASKGDNARLIEFTLTDGGAIYAIADDCTAIFRAQKPDGTVLFNSCEIVGDRIKYQMTSQTTMDVGILQCELEIIGADSKVLTAPRFTIRVADTVYSDDEIESTDEFTALTEAIQACENLDIEATKVGDTATVTITDKDGVQKSVEIYDGEKGEKGDKGDKGDPGDYSVVHAPLGTGWSGNNGTVERGGRTCVLKVLAQYVSGGTLCTIPEGYRSLFAGHALGIVLRSSVPVGIAYVGIQSTGEVGVLGVYGTTLQQGDYVNLQTSWVC